MKKIVVMLLALVGLVGFTGCGQSKGTAVKIIDIIICNDKQLPNIFSAVSLSFFPIKMDALGAPPELIKAAKAETIIINGKQTPTPVKAKSPISSIWPMNILSTTLYNIFINWANTVGIDNLNNSFPTGCFAKNSLFFITSLFSY